MFHMRSVFLLAVVCPAVALAACGDRSTPTDPPVEVTETVTITTEPQVEQPAVAPAAATLMWDAETPVGRVVAEAPAAARIFELVEIDYCCGGNRTLAQAAAEKEVEVGTLLAALAAVRTGKSESNEIVWDQQPLPELLEHIEATHHVFLRRELPRLAKIVATVTRVHGAAHPELADVKKTFTALYEELLPHLVHEEEVVFPAVRTFDAGESSPALEVALAQMRREHDGAGKALHELRRLLDDYDPPIDACTLYKQMLSGLRALEKDTLRHVHLENNVLLPRCSAKN